MKSCHRLTLFSAQQYAEKNNDCHQAMMSHDSKTVDDTERESSKSMSAAQLTVQMLSDLRRRMLLSTAFEAPVKPAVARRDVVHNS